MFFLNKSGLGFIDLKTLLCTIESSAPVSINALKNLDPILILIVLGEPWDPNTYIGAVFFVRFRGSLRPDVDRFPDVYTYNFWLYGFYPHIPSKGQARVSAVFRLAVVAGANFGVSEAVVYIYASGRDKLPWVAGSFLS